MLTSAVRYFYPDLRQEEIKKFSLLSIAFFLIIGSYWLLRLLKDTIFFTIAFPEELGWAVRQGSLFQPTAKLYSVFVVIAMVLIYSKLVDLFKKHQLFYIICSFYAVIFASVAGVLLFKDLYGIEAVGRFPLAAMGWVSYFAIESFGSLVAALFWSFSNSITDSSSAKRGFPLIVAGAQVGAVAGSSLMIFTGKIGSLWPLLAIATLFVVAVMLVIRHFMKVVPAEQMVGDRAAAATEKEKDGFIWGFVSGLWLLLSRPYLLGVLVISTFYEAAGQILDYQMKAQASAYGPYSSSIGFAKFMGIFGVCANGLALVTALLGTSYIMKKYGIRFCLLVYPISFAIASVALLLYYLYGAPSAGALLWATFGVMMIVKGISYSVNNPTKEMMYIPTSKDAKFKSKGWVDMFGGRLAKAGGAQVTDAFKSDLGQLMVFGTMFGLGLIGFWILAAIYVGIRNTQLVKEGKIVQ